VYKSVSQLRSAELTRTGLFSTEEVFAFARASSDDLGNSLMVVMNVMEEEVSVSLMDLILEMGITFNGQVLVRSSGPAEEGNTVGTIVDLNNLTLAGNQALILN